LLLATAEYKPFSRPETSLQEVFRVVQYFMYTTNLIAMPKISQKNHLTKLGKTQAREQFAPLVESLATIGGVIEVTDYGKVSAVMMGYKDYLWLLAQANQPFKPTRTLAGSAILLGDLERDSEEISKSIIRGVKKLEQEL